MAENNWLLNDSSPASVGQEFSAAASEKAWGWFGLPAAGIGSEFETPAAESVETPWTPLELAFNGAESGGGGGDVTGTSAAIKTALTASATGAEIFSGTAAAAKTALTSSATAAEIFSGTASATTTPLTSSATAAEVFSGTAAGTKAPLASSASGAEIFSGTASAPKAALTSSANAALVFAGTADATKAALVSSAAGTAASSGITGTADATKTPLTASVTGAANVAQVQGGRSKKRSAAWLAANTPLTPMRVTAVPQIAPKVVRKVVAAPPIPAPPPPLRVAIQPMPLVMRGRAWAKVSHIPQIDHAGVTMGGVASCRTIHYGDAYAQLDFGGYAGASVQHYDDEEAIATALLMLLSD